MNLGVNRDMPDESELRLQYARRLAMERFSNHTVRQTQVSDRHCHQ